MYGEKRAAAEKLHSAGPGLAHARTHINIHWKAVGVGGGTADKTPDKNALRAPRTVAINTCVVCVWAAGNYGVFFSAHLLIRSRRRSALSDRPSVRRCHLRCNMCVWCAAMLSRAITICQSNFGSGARCACDRMHFEWFMAAAKRG